MNQRLASIKAGSAHRVIHHRLAQKHIDKHRHILAKHKARGAAFAAAVERLEKLFDLAG